MVSAGVREHAEGIGLFAKKGVSHGQRLRRSKRPYTGQGEPRVL